MHASFLGPIAFLLLCARQLHLLLLRRACAPSRFLQTRPVPSWPTPSTVSPSTRPLPLPLLKYPTPALPYNTPMTPTTLPRTSFILILETDAENIFSASISRRRKEGTQIAPFEKARSHSLLRSPGERLSDLQSISVGRSIAMISVLMQERLLGAALGSIFAGVAVFEQRKSVYSLISENQSPSTAQLQHTMYSEDMDEVELEGSLKENPPSQALSEIEPIS
ncbi:hypothetical protein Syun_000973 [Stephania yunnanensis]|uniref:Uncharacterized protein n=1 Tax=Stephania yunnanensis TaxID=152371 RepID=A0AAP0Q6N8_9MAGN